MEELVKRRPGDWFQAGGTGESNKHKKDSSYTGSVGWLRGKPGAVFDNDCKHSSPNLFS